MKRLRLIGALILAVSSGAHAADSSVKDIVDLVRAAISQHTPDKSLAKTLHKVTLAEKLDLRAIEELESEGAGPEAVAALESLLESSASKPLPTAIPPFKSPARPSVEEQREFFHKVNVNAMSYSRSLPDFICTEVVHRYQKIPAPTPGAPQRRGGSVTPQIGAGYWVSKDVLSVKLSYFENREKYELTLVNGRKTKETYESSGGAISEGDFGSVLLEVFSRESATKFQWDHWTHLRKRLTRVYAYRTSRDRSHYRIGVGQTPDERRVVVAGRRGFVYADDETGMVMRITGEATEIPLGFPITAQASTLDYQYANVGDQRYLLPLRVDNFMKTAQLHFKNVVEFKDYRKFTGESTISFDVPEPLADTAAPPTPPEKKQ
jgi:hypothetical protein